jgi:hypothetical protein
MKLLKRLHHRVTGLFVTAAAFLFCFAVTAFAATADTSSTSGFLSAILPPILDLAVTVLATGGAWLVGRLIRLTGVDTEAKRLDVEGKLREALHFAAENGLRFALTRAGMPAIAQPTADIIADAMFYVMNKNPETLDKLGVSISGLEDIIHAKWPIASLGLPIAASSAISPTS